MRRGASRSARGTSGHGGRTSATSSSYLVEFKAGTDPYLEAGRLQSLGVDVVEVYTNVFNGVAVRAAPNALDVLQGQPFVKHFETDPILKLDAVESSAQPATEQTGPPWGLDRLDQRSLPLSNSYSYTSSGAGVTAYIVDSGIFSSHADFGGRVRSGFTTVLDGLGTDDCIGHGTHVAGIVGGQSSGVAKSVSLVAVRVLDCGGTTSASALLDALDWVIADHQAGVPAVANISIGGPQSSLLDAAVQAVISDGVTVIAAAGNETQNACNRSPARVPAALTVAASAENDARASFSNFGQCVDLFAPGMNISSAGIASTTEIVPMSGTSMSAPHVAGAAAVLLSERPTWTPAQVARDLLASATVGVIADGGPGSPNALLFASPSTPPANDQFSSAAAFDLTLPSSIVGTNVDATTEPGEPIHGPITGGTSVWWTFIAPEFGMVTLSTDGSTFDTTLAVYSGTAVSALTSLGSNDGLGNGSSLTIRVEAGRTYHVAVDGVDGSSGSITLAHTWRPSSFVSLVPSRLLESRAGPGLATVDGLFSGLGARAGGSVTELTVAGRGGVAADASAVVLTVTATQPVAAGFVTVFPCGSPRPRASNVNFVSGATVANSVVSGVGTDGRVCLFTMVDTDLVVDVNGYFPASSLFASLVPPRLLESRAGPGMATSDGLFAGLGVRRGGSVTELVVAGRGGIAADASAVVLTVTATQPVGAGFVTVFPCGSLRPLASNVNFVSGATVANMVVSGVGTGGRVCLFTMVDTDLVVDVNGYFPAVSSFASLVPARLLESRAGPGMATVDGFFSGLGVRAGGSVTELNVAGRGGVAADASAVVLTVTVTKTVAAGFVTVFPCGSPRPFTSNVNFVSGATVANSVVSGVGTGGRVCLFTMVDTDLVVDVNAFFP